MSNPMQDSALVTQLLATQQAHGWDGAHESAKQEVVRRLSQHERYRKALEEIAGADLKRCSAGWLVGIAKRALEDGDASA